MKTFNLDVLTAEKVLYQGECTSLIYPAPDGMCGIMAGHSDLVSLIVPGTLTIKGSDTKKVSISGGIITVRSGRVTILAE